MALTRHGGNITEGSATKPEPSMPHQLVSARVHAGPAASAGLSPMHDRRISLVGSKPNQRSRCRATDRGDDTALTLALTSTPAADDPEPPYPSAHVIDADLFDPPPTVSS
jgi:hypothetical protein